MLVAKVHRIPASAPNDVSGIAQAIAQGLIDPKGIVAILGKTEGNGNVNDFTRGFATQSLTLMLEKRLGDRAREVCLVMSGGTEGAMAPHWTVFERAEGDSAGPALAIGRAADVHFVQIKCPLLTAQRIAEAEARRESVATRDTLKSMGLSRAASSL